MGDKDQIMNDSLKQKLLLILARAKKGNGFTLIELLVVIIIIGILSAVSLPNLLGQTSKARQSEAKTNLGALIRGQQAYRLEEGQFADDLGELDVSIESTFYTYSASQVSGTSLSQAAQMGADDIADFEDDLKSYVAGVAQPAGGNFSSVICEDTEPNASSSDIAKVNGSAGCSAGVEVD